MFRSNLLLNHISLFYCAILQCLPLVWPISEVDVVRFQINSSWVTVTVTVPYMSLPTTTLMRCFMFSTTFGPPAVHYGRRPVMIVIPCSNMIPTSLTLLARFFFLWEGNHRLPAWFRYINKHHSVDKDWHISVHCIVVDPRNCVVVFLNAINDIVCFLVSIFFALFLAYLFLVGPWSMTMSRTTFPRSRSTFEHLGR